VGRQILCPPFVDWGSVAWSGLPTGSAFFGLVGVAAPLLRAVSAGLNGASALLAERIGFLTAYA